MFSDSILGEEEEEEEDDDDLEQTELEVSKALGIDLTRFVKNDVLADYKKEVNNTVKEVIEKITVQRNRIDDEIKAKGYEYTKGVEIIEKKLATHMKPVQDDMQELMRTRQRWTSDDETRK